MIHVLKAGGNAADAGIARAMVQAAVEPFTTNDAGGVTILYSKACTELCRDAIAWAEQRHAVSPFGHGIKVWSEKFIAYFPEGRKFSQSNGRFSNIGEVFEVRWAKTMRGVTAVPDYMIPGPWAEAFVRKVNDMSWEIRPDHMAETALRWVEPVRHGYHEFAVVTLSPPQARGFVLSVGRGVLKHLGIQDTEPRFAEDWWAMGDGLQQAQRHWEYIHDEQIFDVSRDAVLDHDYHAHLSRLILGSRPKINLSEHFKLEGNSDGAGVYAGFLRRADKPGLTRHDKKRLGASRDIGVFDAEGNWAQTMKTPQAARFPGGVVGGVPMAGSYATFSHRQSSLDATHVKVAKERRIIGSTLVLKDCKSVFSADSPGNIFPTLSQVLAYYFPDSKLNPHAAVDVPRMLPMSESCGIAIENRMHEGVVEVLHKIGARVGVVAGYDYFMGHYSAIARDAATNILTAIADPGAARSQTASGSDHHAQRDRHYLYACALGLAAGRPRALVGDPASRITR